MKFRIKHTQTPRFSPLFHLSRATVLPSSWSMPEDFYSIENLSGFIPRVLLVAGGKPKVHPCSAAYKGRNKDAWKSNKKLHQKYC